MKLRLLLYSLLATTVLHAQEETPKLPLPAGPIIRPLPELAEWTVSFEPPRSTTATTSARQTGDSPDAETTHPKSPRRIVVTKSGKTYREVETGSDGKRWERWKVRGSEVSLAGKGRAAVVDSAGSGDFGELGWISPENYTEVANVARTPCFIFQSKIPMEDVVEPVEVTAAVSVATQLPVYFVLGGAPRTYTFGPQPGAPLNVPQEVESVLADRHKLIEGLFTRP